MCSPTQARVVAKQVGFYSRGEVRMHHFAVTLRFPRALFFMKNLMKIKQHLIYKKLG